MLGDRRSNSLFTKETPMPEVPPVAETPAENTEGEVNMTEAVSAVEDDSRQELLSQNRIAPKASAVFFGSRNTVDFSEALSQVQGYLSGEYAALITESNTESKDQMKRLMARYLQDKRLAVEGFTTDSLVDALYTEMAEYGFLTKYIFADGIEEIDINSWRDIEVQYSDGRTVKLNEHFDSPEHAANVVRRMLQNSGKVLDNASPVITSRLAKNIRVAVIKAPVLDEDAGVAAVQPPAKCWISSPPACATACPSAWRAPPAAVRPLWRAGCSPPSRTTSAFSPLRMAPESCSSSGNRTAG